ncbi:MAG: 1-deoxy-D-xylulose-5-phosphate synthase [Deltaproteobacteria bacterium]|nr:1-deoxy-D-xylulose-5-phosphate synthase [Deltaproteobacteria bacterium]
MSLLDKIKDIDDLKMIPVEELPMLAKEIRSLIIDVVSKNGGHLASSLGVVELTIALHYVFDIRRDKIIWDTGHQSYAHKILTGRKERFHTLRQYKGISGFTNIKESIYDVFGTGHASTSISAALGIAEGMRITNQNGHTIAIIGDGGMSSGLAFEGLNNAGHMEKDLIVILNDNEMSIGPNTGALSRWFSRKFASNTFSQTRQKIKNLLNKVPSLTNEGIMLARRVINSSKVLLTPGILFEGLNFQYIGPLDGHNIFELLEFLSEIKKLDGPVLVHVCTQKGKGYQFAELNPEKFHGITSFNIKTGDKIQVSPNSRTFTDVFSEIITDIAEKDNSIIAITAAMTDGCGLKRFKSRFPDRFYDVGIAESHAVTFAAGLATQGLKPVVCIYSTFLQRSFDMIIHDVALQNLKVIFAIDRAGIVGEDGPTHNGSFDLSYLSLIPNLKIIAPCDEVEMRQAFEYAIETDGPVAIRYPRANVDNYGIGLRHSPMVTGRGEIVYGLRDISSDVLIITLGSMVYESIRAAKILEKMGVKVTVFNARFAKPLDKETISRLSKYSDFVITVEENTIAGGFGSYVNQLLIGEHLKNISILNIGIPDMFIEHGPRRLILDNIGLSFEKIALRIRNFVAESKKNNIINYPVS